MHDRLPRRLGSGTGKAPLADPVLRHHYGGQLESAAESFLLSAFEGEARGFNHEAQGPSAVLVSAAMHILTKSAWTQPTDEQVRAAVYLGQRPAEGEPAEARAA